MTTLTRAKTDKPVPVEALTGSRIFLALFVVCFHFGQRVWSDSPAILRNIGGSGYVSVSMFFLLSGYVLAYNYLGGEAVTRKVFWIARLARIAPAYWTAMGVSLAFYVYACVIRTANAPSFATVATALTVTQAWFLKLDLWNFPAWSLTCECFFYALFPFLAAPIVRLNRARLRWAIVALAFACILPPLVYLLWLPDGVPYQSLTQANLTHFTLDPRTLELQRFLPRMGVYGTFMYNPLVHTPIFLLGMALGRYKLAFAERRRTFFSVAIPHGSLMLLLMLLAVSGWMPHLLLHDGLAALAFAGFVFYADTLSGPLSRLLSAPAVVLFGEASYAVYILQMPMWQAYESIMRHLHLGPPDLDSMTLAVLVGFLVFLCGAAIMTFCLVERPCRRWIRTTLTSRTTLGRS